MQGNKSKKYLVKIIKNLFLIFNFDLAKIVILSVEFYIGFIAKKI
jgi:hypothetical protein